MAKPCYAAWKHLSVKSATEASVCCAWNTSFKVDNWGGVEHHPELIKFRSKALSEDWPSECGACRTKSSKGISSRKDVLNGDVTHDQAVAIEVLEINLTNLCNYSCVMCNGDFSSKWHSIERQVLKGRSKINSTYKIDLPTLDQLVALVQRNPVRRIELQGGEPFILAETIYFLGKLEEISYSGEVWIVTNGSLLPEQFLKYVTGRLRLFITVSLDTSDEQLYKVIRSPEVSVHTVIENIGTLKRNFENVFISMAVGCLNAFQYNELDALAIQLVGRPASINWIQRPHELQLFRLSPTQREWTIERLNESPHQGPYAKRIIELIHKNAASSLELEETRQYLQRFCQAKGIDNADIHLLKTQNGRESRTTALPKPHAQ